MDFCDSENLLGENASNGVKSFADIAWGVGFGKKNKWESVDLWLIVTIHCIVN